MNRWRPGLCGYLLVGCGGALLWLHSPCLQADNGAAAASTLSDAKAGKLMADGKRVLLQGKPDVAISSYFDPVIHDFEQRFANSGEQVYSAHSMTETFVYMGMAGATNEKAKAKIKAVALDGTWADALALKAYALVELNRLEEAKATLKQATDLAPLYFAPWNELGYIFEVEKNWPAAMDAYQHAANGAELTEEDKSPHDGLTRALRGQGYVLTEQGNLDEAEALYNRCLKLNPDDGHAKGELAYIAGLRKQQPVTPVPAAGVSPAESGGPPLRPF